MSVPQRGPEPGDIVLVKVYLDDRPGFHEVVAEILDVHPSSKRYLEEDFPKEPAQLLELVILDRWLKGVVPVSSAFEPLLKVTDRPLQYRLSRLPTSRYHLASDFANVMDTEWGQPSRWQAPRIFYLEIPHVTKETE